MNVPPPAIHPTNVVLEVTGTQDSPTITVDFDLVAEFGQSHPAIIEGGSALDVEVGFVVCDEHGVHVCAFGTSPETTDIASKLNGPHHTAHVSVKLSADNARTPEYEGNPRVELRIKGMFRVVPAVAETKPRAGVAVVQLDLTFEKQVLEWLETKLQPPS